MNQENTGLQNAGFNDFYNMLDDFFSGSMSPTRSLTRDTFKIDIEDKEDAFVVEAELPGIQKDEIDLSFEEDMLSITVNRKEEVNKDEKNYIHRERRSTSMSRRIRLSGANLDDISAKLDEGVLSINIPKAVKPNTTRKIEIG